MLRKLNSPMGHTAEQNKHMLPFAHPPTPLGRKSTFSVKLIGIMLTIILATVLVTTAKYMFVFTPPPPPLVKTQKEADSITDIHKTIVEQPIDVVPPPSPTIKQQQNDEDDDDKEQGKNEEQPIAKTTGRNDDMPRVALLFLTRGPLPLEPVWKMWFETAAMMEAPSLPISPPQPLQRPMRQQQSNAAAANTNNKRRLSSSRTLMNTTTTTTQQQQQPTFDAEAALRSIVNTTSALSIPSPLLNNVIAQQSLFTVYVHTASNYSFPQDSIFAGQQIKDRVNVAWGQWSVAEAEKRLYTAALKDERNQRFILLSESCMPLYPPHILWAQALSEQRSRVRACEYKQEALPWYVRYGFPSAFKVLWRKSSQWKMLIRPHAELVANDDVMWRIFIRACYTFLPGKYNPPTYIEPFVKSKSMNRNCISDEHYVPTLLNYYQDVPETETTCVDSMMYTAWTPGIWSPKIYNSSHINGELLRNMRKVHDVDEECDARGALESANALFGLKGRDDDVLFNGEEKKKKEERNEESVTYEKPLDQDCHLFARKFAPSAVDTLLELARECDIRKGLAIGRQCYSQSSE